jgi:hypothetical protein
MWSGLRKASFAKYRSPLQDALATRPPWFARVFIGRFTRFGSIKGKGVGVKAVTGGKGKSGAAGTGATDGGVVGKSTKL